MLQINELPIGSIFYATNKFTLTFKDGRFQYGGVIRHGSCIIRKFRALGKSTFKEISPISFETMEVKKSGDDIVKSAFFDSNVMVGMHESDLLREWYKNAEETIETFNNYESKGRNLNDWILNSKKIKIAIEKNPEKWI